MITISSETKISKILNEHPDALEAIVSVSPKFAKLRNPLLRKIMASRTSLLMASKVGGCSVEDFFTKLEPLGFKIQRNESNNQEVVIDTPPEFFTKMNIENLIELDVRPVIESGNDPFKIILQKINTLKVGQVLKLINSFEPAPLIAILESKGYLTHIENIKEDLIYTYFYKAKDSVDTAVIENENPDNDWDEVLERFKGNILELDVRHLEMPRPLLAILDNIKYLTHENAIFVHHKKVPVYLLPQLQEQNLEYRINEIGDGDVKLIIFRKE